MSVFNWEGWTSESCIKNGHWGMFYACIGCGKPLKEFEKDKKKEQPKLVEKVDYDLVEVEGEFKDEYDNN